MVLRPENQVVFHVVVGYERNALACGAREYCSGLGGHEPSVSGVGG